MDCADPQARYTQLVWVSAEAASPHSLSDSHRASWLGEDGQARKPPSTVRWVPVRLADHGQQIRIDLFGHQTTITEIRIHGYEYDSNIKAASCVALDVVYLQSMSRTRSDCRTWRALSGLLANGSSSSRHRPRTLALGTVLSQIATPRRSGGERPCQKLDLRVHFLLRIAQCRLARSRWPVGRTGPWRARCGTHHVDTTRDGSSSWLGDCRARRPW